MASPFFFVSYPMLPDFLQTKKKTNDKIKRWYPKNTNKSELEDWSKF